MLARIVVLAIVARPVVVVIIVEAMLMMAVMVVAIVHVIFVAVSVDVNKHVGERADGRCTCHADGRGQGKHGRQRPNEGVATSACSLQSRQHALGVHPWTCVLAIATARISAKIASHANWPNP